MRLALSNMIEETGVPLKAASGRLHPLQLGVVRGTWLHHSPFCFKSETD